ncbi:DinB family protein [Chitinophaga sp.]|uniref:DinB family protein n=1 Tax=Chitinophaga sp. TaxID=1869181 RepID=UPI002B52CDDD|nr:DinB family protein [Chitinophaga sp.]HWV68686.1 DinB family protein [Chitinophaga sp.]
MENNTLSAATTTAVITPEQLLKHWQGHRALTRRMIEAFPDDQLFTFSIGGMRPFSTLVMEFCGMAFPSVYGVITDEWLGIDVLLKDTGVTVTPTNKAELLQLWDVITEKLNEWWPKIPAENFQKQITAFGQYEGRSVSILFYIFDNEIHHRGQGYVYLRALGIEPPAFWDRDQNL